jgi:1-acyl-sn-glycerol-3-phosphate acyltransferase
MQAMAPADRNEPHAAADADMEPRPTPAPPVPESERAGDGRANGALVPVPDAPLAVPVPGDRLAVHIPPVSDQRLSDVDEWGRSEQWRHRSRIAFGPLYRNWFRVEWEGLEHVPRDGGALLVANHAAVIPSDAPVIMHGIETELGRPVYGLADHLFRSAPVLSTLWSRVGGVGAHPDNAYRLLREQEQLVLVFPEGARGPAKTYADRYQLRRFGRGGFVEIAMRAGVPIIPIAVVGAEESMPMVWSSPTLARLTGLPYAGITANLLLLGPIGLVAYLPAKFKLRVLEPVHIDVPPGRERYSRSLIMDESERIRELIQSALFDMLRARRSVWFG